MCTKQLSVLHGMNKKVADTKIYFRELHNVFAFEKLLICGSHISADQIQQE